jgi:hypothetical protein
MNLGDLIKHYTDGALRTAVNYVLGQRPGLTAGAPAFEVMRAYVRDRVVESFQEAARDAYTLIQSGTPGWAGVALEVSAIDLGLAAAKAALAQGEV